MVWVSNFSELTAELLESRYEELMARRQEFSYEKLTQQYWRQRVLDLAAA